MKIADIEKWIDELAIKKMEVKLTHGHVRQFLCSQCTVETADGTVYGDLIVFDLFGRAWMLTDTSWPKDEGAEVKELWAASDFACRLAGLSYQNRPFARMPSLDYKKKER